MSHAPPISREMTNRTDLTFLRRHASTSHLQEPRVPHFFSEMEVKPPQHFFIKLFNKALQDVERKNDVPDVA